MCVDGHGDGFLFKGMQEAQGYAAKGKDPDEQVHAVIGGQHCLPGDHSFDCSIGHLLGLGEGDTLCEEALYHLVIS